MLLDATGVGCVQLWGNGRQPDTAFKISMLMKIAVSAKPNVRLLVLSLVILASRT